MFPRPRPSPPKQCTAVPPPPSPLPRLSSISNLWPAGRPVIPSHPTVVIYHPPPPARQPIPGHATDNPKTASKVIPATHTHIHTLHTVRKCLCFVFCLFALSRTYTYSCTCIYIYTFSLLLTRARRPERNRYFFPLFPENHYYVLYTANATQRE